MKYSKIFNLNRHLKNRLSHGWMFVSLIILILLPIVIGVGLFSKSIPLLSENSIIKLLFSGEWKPLSGNFGLLPFILSSLWVTFIALLLAAPVCVLSAIHLTQYAKKWFLKFIRPVIDILAGIPSVIFGVWGVLVIVPLVSQHLAPLFGKQVSGYSILAGGIVLAIMIIPFILNILIEVFRTIPDELSEASLSLGASRWQTIKLVILRKAFPGVFSALVLGVSRAFGETIAVLMVVGNVVKIPTGIFQPGYPLPALIANNYGEMLSIPKYESALMLSALVLFVVVLIFNLLARVAIARFESPKGGESRLFYVVLFFLFAFVWWGFPFIWMMHAIGSKLRHKFEEWIFRVTMFLASSIIVAALFLIIFSILRHGLPYLSWEMLTQTPKGGFYFGKEGGILNSIIGSLYLASGATILAFAIGLPVSLYMNIHIVQRKKLVHTIRFFLDVLWGIPSIVYGAFGFTLMIFFGLKASLLAGIITVALFIVPIMVRGMDEVLKTVPIGLLESTLSLGATKAETAFKVFFRQCIPGIITALLLSFGRAIGDAASVLFTTGFTDNIPTSLSEPTATLPLAIFFQLSSPIAEVKGRAYASALVLTVIILVISILSRILSKKFHKTSIKH